MRNETEIRELKGKLYKLGIFNIVGTKGGDAYIVSTGETEDMSESEAELRSKRNATKEPLERLILESILRTVHFEQYLSDWIKEVMEGFKLADGDYLDYAYVLLYCKGLTGEEACKFMGIQESRGGNRSVHWKKISKEILKRDNYTCSECGSHEQLQVHHKGWWWDNNTPDKLVTLCQKCHSKQPITLKLGQIDSEAYWKEAIGTYGFEFRKRVQGTDFLGRTTSEVSGSKYKHLIK